jgi:hypothetical protein
MKMKTLIIFLLSLSPIIAAQDQPSWVSSFPYSVDYYTGIGSSNQGNRSLDYERALIQARLNLAAEISSKISSETIIESYDRGKGDTGQSFQEKLIQRVEQNLRELEIVDTWYSETQGYWVYVRLLKNTWEQIKEEETAALVSRIQDLLEEKYFSPLMTTAEKLNKLGASARILTESPYGAIASGILGGVYSGNIYDFILSEIYRLSSSISINLTVEENNRNSKDQVNLRIICSSQDNYTGKLPLLIKGIGEKEVEIQTGISGTARATLRPPFIEPGLNTISVSIKGADFGFDEDSPYLNSFFSERSTIGIRIDAPSLFLSLQSNRQGHPASSDGLSALFSEKGRSFEMTESRDSSSFELMISLTYSDFPRVLDNAPIMAGLTALISLKENERLIYEYETDSFKDGGLSNQQAYERVYRKMLESLSVHHDFIGEIEKAIVQ